MPNAWVGIVMQKRFVYGDGSPIKYGIPIVGNSDFFQNSCGAP